MRVTFLLCVLALGATACMDDSAIPPGVPGIDEMVVYEAGPHLAQCSPPALTLAQSAAKLTSGGIEVRRSSCGHIEGVMYPAVCGAGTGEILLHDIPASSLGAAEAAGFASADKLTTGWRRAACPQYLHAIDIAQSTTSCAGIRNRVLVIQDAQRPDERVVLLDQAGACADASYRQVLFGGSGDRVLCSNADSIAGPQKNCAVSSHSGMFETILANLDREDLGLGAGYYVMLVFPA